MEDHLIDIEARQLEAAIHRIWEEEEDAENQLTKLQEAEHRLKDSKRKLQKLWFDITGETEEDFLEILSRTGIERNEFIKAQK